jgi:hypothetical protein
LWHRREATLIRMTYCGTAGKPGGKQRKQTSSYSQGSLQPTRTAPKTNACMKSCCRRARQVPTRLGYGEGRCRVGRNEHVHHWDSRGKGPDTRGKRCGENAGKGLFPAGAHSNRQRLRIRAKAKRHRGSRSGACVRMSEEGRVMLAEGAENASPDEVTPWKGKGALGHSGYGACPSPGHWA